MMRSGKILRGDGLSISACLTLTIAISSASTRIVLGDRSRILLSSDVADRLGIGRTCMYHSLLVQEVYSCDYHVLIFLQEGFLQDLLSKQVS